MTSYVFLSRYQKAWAFYIVVECHLFKCCSALLVVAVVARVVVLVVPFHPGVFPMACWKLKVNEGPMKGLNSSGCTQ